MGSKEGHVFLEEHFGERHWFFILGTIGLFVPVLFLLLFEAFGVWVVFEGTVMGGLGWIVAFSLTQPLGLSWQNVRAHPLRMVGFGPLKQGVILALLLLTSRALPWAVSIGLGWIMADAIWAIWDGAVVLNPDVSMDDRRAALSGSFTQQVSLNKPPLRGVLEMIPQAGLQMGLVLLLQASPWWILLTAPVQGIACLGKWELSRRSVPWALGASAALAAVVFVFGWLAPVR